MVVLLGPDGELLTPPLEDRILASITRSVVIAGGRRHGAAVHPGGRLRGRGGVPRVLDPRDRSDRRAGRQAPARRARRPVTLRARRALAQRIERELGAVA